MASGVKLGGKEIYMKDFESFTTENIEKVQNFYNKLCVLPSVDMMEKHQNLATVNEVNTFELPKTHKFIVKNFDGVLSSLVKNQHLDVIPEFVANVVLMGDPEPPYLF